MAGRPTLARSSPGAGRASDEDTACQVARDGRSQKSKRLRNKHLASKIWEAVRIARREQAAGVAHPSLPFTRNFYFVLYFILYFEL